MSGTETQHSSHPDAASPATAQTPAQKLAAELMSTDEFSQYLLKAKSEMFAVFRGMVEHVSQITMFFNEGRDMVLTDMVSYGDGGVYLDLGASPEMNQKALEADKLFCVTQLDKVKVQFILRGLRRVEWNGGPAFLAALPDSVLRLQRREYYRMATPIARPLKCAISFPDCRRRTQDDRCPHRRYQRRRARRDLDSARYSTRNRPPARLQDRPAGSRRRLRERS
jgi:hypothetical protein